MDIVTQAALGATIGQAGYRRFGRRSLAFGGLCGVLPDMDSLFGVGDPWQGLVTHRGLSHSLLVLPFVAVPLGWLAWRFLGRRGRPKDWINLAFWALVTHPLLDVCTTFGTQLMAPLSSTRFSIDAVAIIDLFFTVPLLIAIVYGARSNCQIARAHTWARNGLIWGCAYLIMQWGWTMMNQRDFKQRLSTMGFEAVAVRTPASLLFPMLRHGVARDKDGRIAVTTLWLFGGERAPIFRRPPNVSGERVDAALASHRGQIWRWFADDMVGIVRDDDGRLVFYDHRYGGLVDPRRSGFRAVLESGDDPSELQYLRPGRGKDKMKPSDEVEAGLRILFRKGEGD